MLVGAYGAEQKIGNRGKGKWRKLLQIGGTRPVFSLLSIKGG